MKMPANFVTKKIGKVRPLGVTLKAARTRQELTIDQVQEKTKICRRFIGALEEGNYALLPADAYNIGFVRAYASFLRLDPDRIVQLYREERSTSRVNSQPDDTILIRPRRMGDWHFLITPKVLAIVGTLVFFGGLAGYIVMQLNHFAQPPELVVTNVPSEFTSTKDSVQLQGKTTAGASVLMNSQSIVVTADGSFVQDVQLNPGVNEINILARNRAQKETREIVRILYTPGLAKVPDSVTTE